ncbi:MAG: hypothetical protein ACYS8Z_21150, partial [Planctomycetota bacterium]
LVWAPPIEKRGVRTSRLAIASTVSGVISVIYSVAYHDSYAMCLFVFISVVAGISALGCGIAALACIELDHPRIKGRLYALIGILLSAIAFAVIDALFARR